MAYVFDLVEKILIFFNIFTNPLICNGFIQQKNIEVYRRDIPPFNHLVINKSYIYRYE